MAFPGPPAPSLVRRLVGPVLKAGVDLLYPRLCCGCQVPLEMESPETGLRAWFCQACEKELPLIQGSCCQVCGEAYEDGAFTREFRCQNCRGRRLEFEFAVAACHADGAVRELVHQFKYQRRLRLRGVLSALLLRTLDEPRLAREDLAGWLLVPVPLHGQREKEREFNQSWELCQRLAQRTGLQAVEALARTRDTDAQASLNRKERLQNLRGAFAVRKTRPWQAKASLAGRRILLVDDVFTTGATTGECARVLRREGGAEKVVVITVARG